VADGDLDRACREFLERIDDLFDETVPAAERAVLVTHLASCERCAELVASMRRTIAACRAAPRPEIRRDCLERAASSLREELARRGIRF
jgi:anti-sigma factor RsiW